MASVSYTDHEGTTRTLESSPGETVMSLAKRNGVPGIIGDCGGVLSCATCHVFVADDDLQMLEPVSDLEDEMLEGTAVDREPSSRLSCQLHPENLPRDLHVTTPSVEE
jgi:2Fe-2S ferredoxin